MNDLLYSRNTFSLFYIFIHSGFLQAGFRLSVTGKSGHKYCVNQLTNSVDSYLQYLQCLPDLRPWHATRLVVILVGQYVCLSGLLHLF